MDLDTLYRNGLLSEIDRAFGGLIRRLSATEEPWIALAAGLVSKAAANGDACLDLKYICDHGIQTNEMDQPIPIGISLERWCKMLGSSSVVGAGSGNYPLILDGRRLYLHRYWEYERAVAGIINARCGMQGEKDDRMKSLSIPPHFIGDDDPDQSEAIHAAVNQKFTVITGGPGTGKTTTIAKIILLLHHAVGDQKPKVILAAPTGKAAARMQEAIDISVRNLLNGHPNQTLQERLEAKTLHRLLGAIPGKTRYRYHQDNPLAADVIIVDEASMIDLALMAKLLQAVPAPASLILVGDKDQLASVEAGSVMGDICAGVSEGESGTPPVSAKSAAGRIADHIVVLKKNYRFGAQSGIGQLGRSINAGNGQRAVDLLKDPHYRHIGFKTISGPLELERALMQLVSDEIAPAFEFREPHGKLNHLNSIRILSPVRKGPFGVNALNAVVEKALYQLGCIFIPPDEDDPWYDGRPVILNRNDYHNDLFNGDVGITMADHGGASSLRIAFPKSDGEILWMTPEQLPDHETVYAMTVHKSQGTEFQKVVLVLPDRDGPILTRELLYTAVTRARQHVEIWGIPRIFNAGVERRMHRSSGLRQALWQF